METPTVDEYVGLAQRAAHEATSNALEALVVGNRIEVDARGLWWTGSGTAPRVTPAFVPALFARLTAENVASTAALVRDLLASAVTYDDHPQVTKARLGDAWLNAGSRESALERFLDRLLDVPRLRVGDIAISVRGERYVVIPDDALAISVTDANGTNRPHLTPSGRLASTDDR